ncbi:MAG: AAA family ATPase [Actinomycetota bacterium]
MSTREPRRSIVFVREGEYGLPYSKGLMANAIAASGLRPLRAYRVAEIIEDRLLDERRGSISTKDLRELARQVLLEEEGEDRAEAYEKWETATHLDRPLVILIGGGTGAGKSTLATQLGARLGIPRVLSTDAIREVLKGVFSQEFQPTLYTSSFDAAGVVKGKVTEGDDEVLLGFRDQAAAVAAGVESMIRRAIAERTDQIIEGAHIVPGLLNLEPFRADAVIVQVVVVVEDENLHRGHFQVRAHDTRARPVERYLAHFDNIRKIQAHIRSQAEASGVPVVSNETLDASLSAVIDIVIDAAVDASRS